MTAQAARQGGARDRDEEGWIRDGDSACGAAEAEEVRECFNEGEYVCVLNRVDEDT